tara:strand:- start:2207 stop:3082 length:876 start_codon:yes stop_codon:yes gene_type:complete
MEIANLQQIISQEKRAGGSTGGIADQYTTASTTAPVVYPTLVAFNERSNSPHGPNFSATTPVGTGIYTRINNAGNASPIVYHLLMGGFETASGTRSTASETIYGTTVETSYTNTWLVSNQSTGYGPFMMSMFFVRNPTAADITTSFTDKNSSYWNSGYDGSGRCMYTPNSTNYADVTSVGYANIWNSSGSSTGLQSAANFTVPAGKTVCLMHACTAQYWTTFSNGGHWYTNYQPHTSQMWTSGLVPDLKMHAAAEQLRDRDAIGTSLGEADGSAILAKLYNIAGEAFGENV